MNFLAAIEQLQFSTWIREGGSIWGYATVLFMHGVGMAMVAGFSAVIDLRLLGFAPRVPVKPLEQLYPLMWSGFVINLISGSILLMADATTKLTNWDFYVKMIFVFAGVALLKIMRRKVFGNPDLDRGPLPGSAKSLAWVSLFCWIAAVTAGRLLAYVGPVSGLPGQVNH
jgi:hypothetical protein